MRHRVACFVAPAGDDTNPGSEKSPWLTIAHALTHLQAGDTLYLREGVYHENLSIACVGREDAPITIRSYPGEVATIDGGGCPEFVASPQTCWEPIAGGVPDYFRSTRAYRNRRYAFGRFADSMVGLITYQHRVDLEEVERTAFEKLDGESYPAPVYIGPGVWHDAASGHIHLRLTHTQYDFRTPGAANYIGPRDPRALPIVISFNGSLPLRLDGAEHVVLQDLEVRGAGENAVRLRGCQYVTLDNVTVHCGTYGLHARSSSGVKILNSGFYGSVPPWQYHASQVLRVYNHQDRMPNGKPPTRDIARLNTHVILAIEGRTEEQVDYAVPSNRDWEIAHSDFTDSLDGIHLGGFAVRFHHNRLDRLMDDALYLTPLTPGAMDGVHVYCNLFTRCLMSLGFGGRSEPGGPIHIYRNIFDQRAEHLWTPGRPARNSVLVTHFQGPKRLGELHIYQNTFISHINPKLSEALVQDADNTYAQSTLSFVQPGVPRCVLNNLFVYLRGMIPPSADSLPDPAAELDLWLDGNVHVDLVDPDRSAAKLEAFRQSELFGRTGWEAHSRVCDAGFVKFDADAWAVNDYRPGAGSAAVGAGLVLPEAYADPFRPSGGARPDAGALPRGAEPFRAGRGLGDGDAGLYRWLERAEASGGAWAAKRTARPSAPPASISDEDPARQLREAGYCVLRGVIPPAIAREARAALHYNALTCGVIAQSMNTNLPRIPYYTRLSVIKDTQHWAPYVADPRLLGVIDAALSGTPRVTATTMVVHEPGTAPGDWHQGEPFDSTSARQKHVTTVWLFSPFSLDNGGYLIRDRAERPLTITGGLGDVIVTDSSLWRAVAANASDVMRLSVVVGYAEAAEHDAASFIPQGVFARLPADTQALLAHWPRR